MTSMRRHRTSVIALGLGAALLVAACGESDSEAEDSPVTTTSTTVAVTTIAPTTTAAPATTPAATTAPATSAPPATTSPATTIAPATTTMAPATTVTPTTTTTTTAAPVTVEYCDAAGPLPGTAVLDHSLTLDMMDDGTANDLIEAYDVDGWSRLRLTTGEGIISEIINPAIDGRYRPLGVALVLPDDSAELFAVIGEGSAAAEIGVFGIDAAECLFSYTHSSTTEDFTMLIRPESPVRSGAWCFDGGIGLYYADQRSDGLWDASSAAYEIATPWSLQYIGASDDFAEGLDESELGTFGFDCFDLSL